MATESLQFFMRPSEFRQLIGLVRTRLGVHVILHRLDPPVLELAHDDSLTLSDGSEPDSIFLAADQPETSQLRAPDDVNPTAWGWVEVDVPRESDGVLYLAKAGAKSDWYDEEADAPCENPAGPRLFRRVARELRAELAGPTWARNTVHGGEEAYRSIRYSTGAAEFSRSGGELRQEGVDNVLFSVDPVVRPHQRGTRGAS